MKTSIKHWIFLLLLFPTAAWASYGWIPKYKALYAKVGVFLFQTSQNFDVNSDLVDLEYQTKKVELVDKAFWLSGEYGIANDWAIELKTSFLASSLNWQDVDGSPLSGASIGDIYTSIKWAVRPITPIITLEAMLKFPTAKSIITEADELSLGDGNFDFFLYVHTGEKSGKFRFSLSPALLIRFGGYSTAVVLDGAIEYRFPRGYIRAQTSFIYSFSDPQLWDSTPDKHDANGSGNSYSRLTGGPIGLEAGGTLGFRLFQNIWLEAKFDHSIFGNKYPNFMRIGANLVMAFDFYKNPQTTKVREVPFDFDYEKFDQQ